MADLTVMAVLKKLGKDILGWVKSNCVNNLVSTATNLPLAANQGKVLDEKIDEINQSLAKLESALDFDANENHIMSSRLRGWGWDEDLGLIVFVDGHRYVLPKGEWK